MDVGAFKASLDRDEPPEGMSRALKALWYDAKGDWHEAHRQAQGQKDEAGAWVHAYLHRVEGDQSNAGYWYRQAGKPACSDSLSEEWSAIVSALLSGR